MYALVMSLSIEVQNITSAKTRDMSRSQPQSHGFYFRTDLGYISAQSTDGENISRISFLKAKPSYCSSALPIHDRFAKELEQYLSGKIKSFSVPFLVKGTDYQKAVWAEISKIPRGQTRSYGEIARCMGQPKAARSVGQACRQNPVPFLIPCHRVVSKDGGLGGFLGASPAHLKIKKSLLDLESFC